MNAIETLRLADPARSSGVAPLGPAEELLLQRILTTPADAGSPPRRTAGRRERRPVLVTLVVAAAVVALAVIAIRLGAQAPRVADPGPTVPTVTTELRQALARVFPAAFDGRSAITWTDASPGGSDDMVDLTGKVPVYAAACEGGGAVAIEISGRPDRILDCTHLATLGPTVLHLGAKGGAGFAAKAASGHPRYLVELIGEAPGATSTPASSR